MCVVVSLRAKLSHGGSGGTIETPWLDVSASIDPDGWATLAVTNIRDGGEITANIDGIKSGTTVEVYTVTGEHINVVNTSETQEVDVQSRTIQEWKGEYEFPGASLTMLRWKIEP